MTILDTPPRDQTTPMHTPPPAAVSHQDTSNLYVSGLAPTVRDQNLREVFTPFGNITSAKVMLNIHTGISRGIAFVKFESPASAADAIKKLNGSSVHGSVISVKIADAKASYNPGQPTNKVFVRNIPLNVTKTQLITHFAQFGQVLECNCQADTAVHKSGGGGVVRTNMAYVTFQDVQTAQRAADESHGRTIFPSCVPLLAKVAESVEKRCERKQMVRTPPNSNKATKSPVAMPPMVLPLASSTQTPVCLPTAGPQVWATQMPGPPQWVLPTILPATGFAGPFQPSIWGNELSMMQQQQQQPQQQPQQPWVVFVPGLPHDLRTQ